MSGGGDTTTTQKSDPWSQQQPYLQQVFGEAQRLYNQPAPSYFPGQTYADFSPEQTLAMQGTADRALAGSPLTNAAQTAATGYASGANLNANPAMAQYQSIFNQQ